MRFEDVAEKAHLAQFMVDGRSVGTNVPLQMVGDSHIQLHVLIPHGSPSGPHGFRPVGFLLFGGR
jgi:hypothetical protein